MMISMRRVYFWKNDKGFNLMTQIAGGEEGGEMLLFFSIS